MQGIYNYIPETNHVFRVYNVAAILWLQICSIYKVSPPPPPCKTFCTLVLSEECVQCPI
jgi:hypothetical protein